MTFGTPNAWFLKLRRKWERKPPQPLERLGLSPDQQETLSRLWRLPAGVQCLRAMETLHRAQVERLLTGALTHDQYCWTTGYIAALEQVAGLPDQLSTARAEDGKHGDRTRPERTDGNTPRLWLNTPEYRAVARSDER